jgi:peroxiredoxin
LKSEDRKNLTVGTVALIVLLLVLSAGAFLLKIRSVHQEKLKGADTEAVAAPAATPDEAAGNLRLGEKMPDFELKGDDGKPFHLADLQDGEHFVVVTFHHPDCPCAASCGKLISEMGHDGYTDVRVVGIQATDFDDERVKTALAQQVKDGIVTFPVYADRDGAVRKLLGATRTPEMWVLDKQGRIAFYGAPENTLFPGAPGHRFLLRDAIDALRKGKVPEIRRYDPIGCVIDG